MLHTHTFVRPIYFKFVTTYLLLISNLTADKINILHRNAEMEVKRQPNHFLCYVHFINFSREQVTNKSLTRANKTVEQVKSKKIL